MNPASNPLRFSVFQLINSPADASESALPWLSEPFIVGCSSGEVAFGQSVTGVSSQAYLDRGQLHRFARSNPPLTYVIAQRLAFIVKH
jgi:hypothetical protein